jgi:hypothetical protein
MSGPFPSRSSEYLPASLQIEGIDQPVILNYFHTLNNQNFQATAALFAEEGVLCPPFDNPVVGRVAIETYLSTEAQGILLLPQRGTAIDESGDGNVQNYKVFGKVRTALFFVNVAWNFSLTSQAEVVLVTVKLLESLEKLMKIRK